MTSNMNETGPVIVNPEADISFNACARTMSLDPDDIWVGRYVDYEWANARYFFAGQKQPVAGEAILEFGCNYGATAIVLAAMGAHVTAVDVNEACVNLARWNAQRYGLEKMIDFLHVSDTTHLPFATTSFDSITCNSVLEYVPHYLLPAVQQEIDRVLKPGGRIFVFGTSNRLWPREVHSRRWFINYMPRALDRYLSAGECPERGVFPWQILRGFGRYTNLDADDGGSAYLWAKRLMGAGGLKLLVFALWNRLLTRGLGVSVGLVTPSICVVLRKPAAVK